jgi:hypothetical protein
MALVLLNRIVEHVSFLSLQATRNDWKDIVSRTAEQPNSSSSSSSSSSYSLPRSPTSPWSVQMSPGAHSKQVYRDRIIGQDYQSLLMSWRMEDGCVEI